MKFRDITYILICLVFFSACDNKLDQAPITSKTADNFYKTEAEIEEAIIATYAVLQYESLYGYNLIALGEIPSDNTFDEVPANDGGHLGDLDQFSAIPQNAVTSDMWRDSYVGIQRANIVLNRIDDIDWKSENLRENRKGEVKFIRALLYFNLVRLFGDVPLVIKETIDANSYFGQGRTVKDKVYEQIITDLTEAVAQLPSTTSDFGRVTEGAAKALLAKVHLTLHDFAAANVLLTDLTDANNPYGYQLLNNISDVFDINNEENAEILFAVQFSSGLNGGTEGSALFQKFSPSGTVKGAKGHNLPTKRFYNLFDNNDLRKSVCLGLTDEEVPYSKKYTEAGDAYDPSDGGSDVIVLRYADILLLRAMAENELGNTVKAIPFLNQVRNRTGLPNTIATSQADVRDVIALERRFELVNEGHRWFDLLASGKAIQVMNAWFASENINITIDVNNLLMPIPKSQIDTDEAIKQNLGY